MNKRLFLSILFFLSAFCLAPSSQAAAPNIVLVHNERLSILANNTFDQNTSFFMNEGTLHLKGNLNESFDKLLLQNSVNKLDFNNTSSIISFDAITGGNGSLSVFNYNYSADPTLSGPQLRVAGRPESALSYVTIAGQPAAYYGATDILVASGSAIPEPSTYALGAGLAAMGLAYLKKRKEKAKKE